MLKLFEWLTHLPPTRDLSRFRCTRHTTNAHPTSKAWVTDHIRTHSDSNQERSLSNQTVSTNLTRHTNATISYSANHCSILCRPVILGHSTAQYRTASPRGRQLGRSFLSPHSTSRAIRHPQTAPSPTISTPNMAMRPLFEIQIARRIRICTPFPSCLPAQVCQVCHAGNLIRRRHNAI